MAGVWIRLRAEFRDGWRGVLALVLIAGFFGGAVLAASAAGRRTASIVDRQSVALNEAHVYVPMFADGPIAPVSPDLVRSLPMTEAAIEVQEVRVRGDVGVVGSLDRRLGTTHGRLNITEGRAVDPDAPDEVVVNPLAAARLARGVGDPVDIEFAPSGARSEAGSFAFGPDAAADDRTITVTFRIVGIGASQGDLVAAAQPHLFVTPAFLQRHGELPEDRFMMVWLRRGAADFAAFQNGLTERSGGQAVFVIDAGIDRAQVARALHMQAVALWLLAASVAIATVLVFGQTLARHIFLGSSDYPTLAALGFSRRQLFALGLGRAGVAAFGGSVLAATIAYVSSAFTPFGLGRLGEPNPGLRFDAIAVVGGGAVILISILLVAIVPAARAALRRQERGDARVPGASRLAGVMGRVLRRPGPAAGARMALESGRGSTAVPVRSTFAGIVISLVAFTAALTVAASMTHLERTPRLYGWNWDAQAGGEDGDARETIGDVPGLAAYAVGAEWVPLEVGGRGVVAIAMQSERGTVQPSMLDGTPPASSTEIALGRTIARRVGARVGDRVAVRVQGADEVAQMRVSGLAVFPRVDDSSSVGEGAFITLDAMYALYPPAPPPANAFVRFAEGKREDAITALRRIHGDDNVQFAEPPSSVIDFGRVANMPAILATLLGLLAAGTLAHGLITTVRRRRRDLAIMKCLGFVRAQVRSAVVWNATVVIVFSMLLAVPIGVAAGRWLWRLIAAGGGFVVEPRVPLVALALAVPAGIILANAVASVPARTAARTQPSVVLRSE